jgi:DNA-directed RNA polymerase specialized sigma24 family protein
MFLFRYNQIQIAILKAHLIRLVVKAKTMDIAKIANHKASRLPVWERHDFLQDCYVKSFKWVDKYDPDKSAIGTWLWLKIESLLLLRLKQLRRIEEKNKNFSRSENENFSEYCNSAFDVAYSLGETEGIIVEQLIQGQTHKAIAETLGLSLFQYKSKREAALNAIRELV